MKRIAIAITLLAATGHLLAQAGKETLGVSEIRPAPTLLRAMAQVGKGASLSRVVEAFDGQLIDRINATRKFELLARSDLKEVFKEQELASSGNMDTADKNTAKVGKLSGAKYLLMVVIDDFEDSTERMEFKTLNQVGLKRKIRLSVVGKIYEASSGKLLESANIQLLKKDDRTDSVELRKDSELTDQLFLDTVREVAEKMAVKVADAVFPIRVLAKRDKQIIINRGEGAGVQVGQLFNVFSLGEELIDPDTKEKLGHEEIMMGKARVLAVQPKTSTCELLEDSGVTKEAVLRSAPQPVSPPQ